MEVFAHWWEKMVLEHTQDKGDLALVVTGGGGWFRCSRPTRIIEIARKSSIGAIFSLFFKSSLAQKWSEASLLDGQFQTVHSSAHAQNGCWWVNCALNFETFESFKESKNREKLLSFKLVGID
jgi:hypothetical protein